MSAWSVYTPTDARWPGSRYRRQAIMAVSDCASSSAGPRAHVSQGTELTIIGAVGDERALKPETFELLPGVERAMHVVKPYKIVARECHPQNTVVEVRGIAQILGRGL